jgi:hypothetical protein
VAKGRKSSLSIVVECIIPGWTMLFDTLHLVVRVQAVLIVIMESNFIPVDQPINDSLTVRGGVAPYDQMLLHAWWKIPLIDHP